MEGQGYSPSSPAPSDHTPYTPTSPRMPSSPDYAPPPSIDTSVGVHSLAPTLTTNATHAAQMTTTHPDRAAALAGYSSYTSNPPPPLTSNPYQTYGYNSYSYPSQPDYNDARGGRGEPRGKYNDDRRYGNDRGYNGDRRYEDNRYEKRHDERYTEDRGNDNRGYDERRKVQTERSTDGGGRSKAYKRDRSRSVSRSAEKKRVSEPRTHDSVYQRARGPPLGVTVDRIKEDLAKQVRRTTDLENSMLVLQDMLSKLQAKQSSSEENPTASEVKRSSGHRNSDERHHTSSKKDTSKTQDSSSVKRSSTRYDDVPKKSLRSKRED